jgi:hypothetical protein
MKTILKPRALGMFLSLLLLCSCATTHHPSAIMLPSALPADVTMNEDAGRGNWLFVTLRLKSGEELPFMVDTGAPGTVLDKSMEPKSGKRLGTVTITTLDCGTQKSGRYVTPRLYLGNTRLMTGRNIVTFDFKQLSFRAGRPIMGVLGMDCLRHYCIQLDFEAGKIRFLDPDHVNAAGLGKAFPLTFEGNRPFIHHVSLTGGKGTNSLIDTGCHADGFVPKNTVRTNDSGTVRLPECVWDDETCTNLIVGVGEDVNLLGLRFLARHLVTLNFPKSMMYLKQTSLGPLVDQDSDAAMEFVNNLKKQGQLPGWSKNDDGTIYLEAYPNAKAVDGRKNGDSSIYHYLVTRASENGPWKLRKAWRTNQNDHTIEEFPVP